MASRRTPRNLDKGREKNRETSRETPSDRRRRRVRDETPISRSDLWTEQEDPEKMANVITGHAMRHRSLNTGRRIRAATQLSAYEGLTLTSLDPTEYDLALLDGAELEEPGDDGAPEYQQTHNLGARVMDAIDAKIFALERTKCRFVVSDGGWAVKTAAVKGGRFLDGQMGEETGTFRSLWDLWRHAARLATIATDSAAIFFWSDLKQGRVVTELDDTLNMWLDSTGLPCDGFTSLGRTTFWDPERLAMRFPDDRTEIYAAARTWETLVDEYSISPDASREEDRDPSHLWRVPLIQGWKLQYGGGEKEGGIDGFEIAAVPNHALGEGKRPYGHETPPCVIFRPMPRLAGKWGRTILERCLPAVQRYNQILNSCDRSERLTPKRMFFYDPTVTDPSQIKIVNDMMFVQHTGSMQQLPQEMTPIPFNVEAARFLLDLHREAAYNLPGLNEAHATMDFGKTMSGVALRLVKNEIYEIFSPLEDEFSRCSGPESGKQIIRCAKEIQEANGGFSSIWKGGKKGGWLQEIGAEVFDLLDKHKYRVEAESVSGTTNTPADNVALARELMEAQIITGEAFAQILQNYNAYGQQGTEMTRAEERIVERMIDDFLYSPIDKARERTVAPELWMDKSMGMTLAMGAGYLNARSDMIEDMDDPEVRDRLQLFKDYLEALTENAQKRAEQQAAAQAAMQPQPMQQMQQPQ